MTLFKYLVQNKKSVELRSSGVCVSVSLAKAYEADGEVAHVPAKI